LQSAAIAFLVACGGWPDLTSSRAGHDSVHLQTSPTLAAALSTGLCLAPLCFGGHQESLTAGPVAPPTIPTIPLGPAPAIPLPVPVPSICPVTNIAMQVLVISANGNEPTLSAIQQALGYHTVPFTTWIATQNPGLLTADKLSSGCDGKYQGVILATGDLVYSPNGGLTYMSALTPTEWLALRAYEQSFKIRELSWYVYPGPNQGLTTPTGGVDTSTAPIDTTLTAAGQKVFPYVNTSNPLPISMAWTYLSKPADPTVMPLLVDAAGNALISSRANADGRETMALTFDSNPYLIHDLVLAHGLVEWVTKGTYLGEFRVYTQAQIDDLFLDNDMYGGGLFRMTDADFNAVRAWQAAQKQNVGASFRLTWPFNGFGGNDTDGLTIAARTYANEFHWLSHTWDHEYLDAISYDSAFWEFDMNNKHAQSQGYPNYNKMNLITPNVSGLNNPNAINAAWDAGVRYLVSDTSQPGWDNPAPNIGMYSTIQPGILIIPRKPTNLYYNVRTPDLWAAEYNSFYTTYWGRALTYLEVLDKESQNLLIYLLQGNIDPVMYHQPNTGTYDGVHTLLTDLLDTAFAKFRRYSTLPIVSPDMDATGTRIANTMARNKAGVVATITPGVKVSFSSPVTVQFAVSGICTATSEIYAGKCITNVKVEAGQTVTFVTL
jgi:hypothetical protein